MGPTKGGFRYGPDVSMGECAALAMWRPGNARCRAALRGAKGGVRSTAGALSLGERERVTRRYAAELTP